MSCGPSQARPHIGRFHASKPAKGWRAGASAGRKSLPGGAKDGGPAQAPAGKLAGWCGERVRRVRREPRWAKGWRAGASAGRKSLPGGPGNRRAPGGEPSCSPVCRPGAQPADWDPPARARAVAHSRAAGPARVSRCRAGGSGTRPPRRIVPPATAISRPPVHRPAELAPAIHRMAFGIDSAGPALDRWRQAAVPAGGL